jgi:hypothetical protein
MHSVPVMRAVLGVLGVPAVAVMVAVSGVPTVAGIYRRRVALSGSCGHHSPPGAMTALYADVQQ